MIIEKSPLLAISNAINHYFAMRSNNEAMLAGLPDNFWQQTHIEKALDNIGLSAEPQKIKLPRLLLPALAKNTDGQLFFISQADNDLLTVISSETPEKAQQITLDQLKELSIEISWHISKKQNIEQRSDFHESKQRHWLLPAINEVKPFYLSLFIGSFAINMLALVIPLFTMNVYDRVVPNAAISTLWVLAIGALLAIVFDWLLKQARTKLADVAGRKIDVKVSTTLFANILGMKLEQRPQSTGAYAKQLQDFDSVREFLTSATLVSAIDLPFTLLFLLLIAWLGGLMVLIPITAMIIIIITGLVLKNKLSHSVEEAAKLSTQKQAHLIEDLNQLIEIKQNNRQGKSQRFWEQTVAQLADWQNESRAIAATLTHTVMSMQQFITIGLIVSGVYYIQAGHISMGALIAMVMISGRASTAISQIASLLLRYEQTTAAMDSVKAILALEQEVQANNLGNSIKVSGNLRVNHLSFNYPEQQLTILNDLNFVINANEKIGLYGSAGSGKSTLLALLAGQYQPSKGQVFYDHIDVKQWSISHIRQHCGWVGQNPQLFYGSVLDNIVQTQQQIDAQHLSEILNATGINQFADRLEAGLESQVGEFGRCLSGGQRQAVAIASALIKKPTLLFLDEPTSSMDELNERLITRTLKNVNSTTMVISSHKASVLAICDKVLVIEKGKLTAIKTPQQLFGTTQRKLRSVSIQAKGDN